MRKYLVFAVVITMLIITGILAGGIGGSAFAADAVITPADNAVVTTPAATVTAPATTPAVTTSPDAASSAPTTPDGFQPFNLNGDTLIFPRTGVTALGAGTNIASFYDGLVSLRAEYAVTISSSDPNMVGIGAGINIPKLIGLAKGTWGLAGFTSDVGILGMAAYDGINKKISFEPAIYLSILKVTF